MFILNKCTTWFKKRGLLSPHSSAVLRSRQTHVVFAPSIACGSGNVFSIKILLQRNFDIIIYKILYLPPKMSVLSVDDVKIKYKELEQDDVTGYCSLSSERAESPVMSSIHRSNSSTANTAPAMDEKRMRREIANSNERRRMRSINAGFQSLRSLLPHHEGEKLSKAAILQQTAEYIYSLQQDKTRLLSQNSHLKRLLGHQEEDSDEVTIAAADLTSTSGSKKRKADSVVEDSSPIIELQMQLERERALRMHLEEKLLKLESLQSEKLTDITHEQITFQYHQEQQIDEVDSKRVVVMEPMVARHLSRRDSQSSVHSVKSESGTGNATAPVQPPPKAHAADSLLHERIHHHHQQQHHTHHQHRRSSSPNTATGCGTIKLKPKAELMERPQPSPVSSPPVTIPISNTASPPPVMESELRIPKLYITSTSRQNLETIVEAIRHLEGDSLFEESVTAAVNNTSQDVPLALTTKHANNANSSPRLLKMGMSPFLQFRDNTSDPSSSAASTCGSSYRYQHRRYQPSADCSPRPASTSFLSERQGVIIMKQQT